MAEKDTNQPGDGRLPAKGVGPGVVPEGASVNGQPVDADGRPRESGAVGALGLALPNPEIGGGDMNAVVNTGPGSPAARDPHARIRRAMRGDFARKIAPFVGRDLSEWGLLGEGDVVQGEAIMLDLDSGEKLRFTGGDNRIIGDRIFANIRNLPESLTSDDALAAFK